MKVLSYLISILLFFSWSIGCNFDVKSSVDSAKASPQTKPTPKDDREQKSWERIYFRSIRERLAGTETVELRDVELAANSLEIRVWTGFDTSPTRGIILRQENGVFTGYFLRPLRSSEQSRYPAPLHQPRSGSGSLTSELNRLEILTLPDPMDIAKIDGGGGPTVVIELKTKDGYRNYKYSGLYENTDDNYVKLREFCEILSREFDIELLKNL